MTLRNIIKKTNLHKRVFYKFDRRTITAPEVNDTWCFDLVDMNSEQLSKSGYILNVIDITSRYAQAVALAHKDKESIETGLLQIMELFGGVTPKKIWSDKESGLSALTGFLKSHNIELYHTENSYRGPGYSVSIVERFNRSMSDKMWVYKEEEPAMNMKQLIHFTINKFIPYYNNKIHSTINMTPNAAYSGVKEETLLQNQQERANEVKEQPKVLLKVGDRVHLQNKKELIRGKKEVKYGREVYTITGIKNTNPITYTISDYGDTGFYKQQFIKAADAKPEDLEAEPEPEKEKTKVEPVMNKRPERIRKSAEVYNAPAEVSPRTIRLKRMLNKN